MDGNFSMAQGSKKGKASKNTSSGKFQLKPELVIAALVAAIFALFIVEAALGGAQEGLLISIFLTLALLVFAYPIKAKAQKKLIYVFVGLSVLSLAWSALRFLNVPAAIGSIGWPAALGIINAVVSAFVIAVILYFEKDTLAKLYVRAGDRKNMAYGIVGLVVSLIVAAGAAYYIFGGIALGRDKMLGLAASVLVFAALGGIVEELWFRGLLMSRIVPIIGESYGNIFQAAVFGVFETVLFYLLTGQAMYLPVIFIISAMVGYYWGRATLKNESLVTPILLHAGFYVLIMLPILVGVIS
jgi:membrane protease YdiL (CAAX protease family)